MATLKECQEILDRKEDPKYWAKEEKEKRREETKDENR